MTDGADGEEKLRGKFLKSQKIHMQCSNLYSAGTKYPKACG